MCGRYDAIQCNCRQDDRYEGMLVVPSELISMFQLPIEEV